MNTENQIISEILKNFKKSPLHKNNFFESDCEVIRLGNNDYLFTIDSYSEEDHFRVNDPYTLGVNLAVCTISDIFACGGRPIFFSNSLTKEESWNLDYVNSLSKGIASILEKCGIGFIGGDIGFSDRWNFTGIVIGETDKLIKRTGVKLNDSIYVTGEIGNGNFEAASRLIKQGPELDLLFKRNKVKFPLREKESQLISKYANACIDTSDGLFKSLNILSEVNNTGFIISGIPYSSIGIDLVKLLSLPSETLMFGESGEYELLFTVSPNNEEKLVVEAESIDIDLHKIGTVVDKSKKILHAYNRDIELSDFNIWGRDFDDHYQYIQRLTEYLKNKITKENV
ncbi:MAG: AIR synthase related protein [Bacteroidota bacterium]